MVVSLQTHECVMNRRPLVLLVEDHEDSREALATLLATVFDVATAPDGRVAIDMLHAGMRPSVILLDAQMPELNGRGFRDLQMVDPDLAGIPVIALTAVADMRRMAQELRVS